MQVIRNFTKRETEKSSWHGDVGRTSFEIEGEGLTFKIDGKEIPAASAEYLMTFALQSLQDAYAGAQDLTEARANFEKKYNALIEGTIGVRSGGGGESEEVRVGRRLVMDVIRTAAKKAEGKAWKDTAKKAELEAMDESELNAKLDAAIEKNAAHFKPLIEAEMERLAEMRRTKAEARAVTVDLDI